MVLFVLQSMEKLSGISQNLCRVLKSLADLFVLYSIAENSGGFLEVHVYCNTNQSIFLCNLIITFLDRIVSTYMYVFIH